MRRLAIAIIVALIAVTANLRSAPIVLHVITGISVIDLSPSSNPDSAANDINDAGAIVGWMSSAAGRTAFLHVDGVTSDLGVWAPSEAHGINRYGDIVGHRVVDQCSQAWYRAPFRGWWDLPSGGEPCRESYARAISDTGTIAGSIGWFTPYDGGTPRVARWRTPLSSHEGLSGKVEGHDINNTGTIVGRDVNPDNPGAFALFDLGDSQHVIFSAPPLPPSGITSGGAYGINNHNQVVGYYGRRAFLWYATFASLWYGTPTTAIDLGTLPYGSFSRAYDINDGGFVVGEADTALTPPQPGTFSLTRQAGFIWHRDFGMRTLPNLPNGDVISECRAYALNNRLDRGQGYGLIQVVGYCSVGGRPHAVRWNVTTFRRAFNS